MTGDVQFIEKSDSKMNCDTCGGSCCKVWFVLMDDRKRDFYTRKEWADKIKDIDDFNKRTSMLKELSKRVRWLVIDNRFVVSAVLDECKYLSDGRCTIHDGDRPKLCEAWGNHDHCDLSRKVLNEMLKLNNVGGINDR